MFIFKKITYSQDFVYSLKPPLNYIPINYKHVFRALHQNYDNILLKNC